MKLYTEEQVKDMFNGYNNFEDITPIELPSDEDIEKELFYQKQVMNPYPTEEYAYTAYEKGFMEGAEWMRDKIQGGNK